MAAPPAHLERSALRVSSAVTAALSVVGVVWGISAGSQMINLNSCDASSGIALWPIATQLHDLAAAAS